MKVYIYNSNNAINEIHSEINLKTDISNCVNDIFGLKKKDRISYNDIMIFDANFSDNTDIYVVLETSLDNYASNQIRENMENLKKCIEDIIKKDQESDKTYHIKIQSEQKHNIIVSRRKREEKTMKAKDDNLPTSETVSNKSSELDYERRSKEYVPVEPTYTFDRVILPEDVIEKLEEALNIFKYERKVFDEWGLYEIQPHPSSSLSFFGPSGTGKTMAAEAIAQKLGRKILKVSYADVESKFHGEGPKMVKAIFLAAERENAVLFFDEADSLLSKRLTNVSQGSEQAINSMRSQLLICLEEFKGIVVFATNLVVNYDSAFLTRLISIEFKRPDVNTREEIWNVHIRPVDGNSRIRIPLCEDVNTYELAQKYDFAGREIRNAVISACVKVAMENKNCVCQSDFIKACDKIEQEKRSVAKASDHTINSIKVDKDTEMAIKGYVKENIKEHE